VESASATDSGKQAGFDWDEYSKKLSEKYGKK
jgi:hypothetical protein